MTEEDNEDYRNINSCQFCEKKIESDKVRDHCHLIGTYKGPAHSKCDNNVTQKESIFIPFIFHNFSNYDCHMFFEKLVDKKKATVKFDIVPKTNEEYISVTYSCTSFIDSYQFSPSGLDSLVKTLVDISHKTLKDFREEIIDNDEIFNIVDDMKITVKKDRYNKDCSKDLKKISR